MDESSLPCRSRDLKEGRFCLVRPVSSFILLAIYRNNIGKLFSLHPSYKRYLMSLAEDGLFLQYWLSDC